MRPEHYLPALVRQNAEVANPKGFARGLVVAVPLCLVLWTVIFLAL